MCGNKVVNVILNSNNKVSGTNNAAVYFIDWGAILKEHTPYMLHWTYTSQPNTLTSASKVAQVTVDFQMEQYLNKSSLSGI